MFLGRMHTNLSPELLHYVSEKMLVEIFSAQERVSIGGFHLENTLLDLQDRDIERPAAQIIHCNSAKTTGILFWTKSKHDIRKQIHDK